MKEETLINEISETVERLWDNAPPRIVLDGWWWKRYIPFFKRQAKVVEMMWDDQWRNGGSDAHRDMLERERKQEIRGFFNDRNY